MNKEVCIFCGDELPSSDIKVKITDKGKKSLLEVAAERNDPISERIKNKNELNQWSTVKFHNKCRCLYIDKRNRSTLKRQHPETENEIENKMMRDDNVVSFDWENLCFICSKGENRKKKLSLSQVSSKADEIRQCILDKCEKSSDLFSRLNSQKNLLEINLGITTMILMQ